MKKMKHSIFTNFCVNKHNADKRNSLALFQDNKKYIKLFKNKNNIG